jgi:hypothetical protein
MFNLPRCPAHDTLLPLEEPPTQPDLGTLSEASEPAKLPEAIYDLKTSELARGLAIVRFAEELNGLLSDLRAASGVSQL